MTNIARKHDRNIFGRAVETDYGIDRQSHTAKGVGEAVLFEAKVINEYVARRILTATPIAGDTDELQHFSKLLQLLDDLVPVARSM